MFLKLDQHEVLFPPNRKVSPSLPPLLDWNKGQCINRAILDADWTSFSPHTEIAFVGLVVHFVSVDTFGLEWASVVALITGGTVAGIDIPDPRLLIDAQGFITSGASDITAWRQALLADVRPVLGVERIPHHAKASERWANDSFLVEGAHQHA
jgi:hypothetical protein